MLILWRNAGQEIVIGDGIVVKLISAGDGWARIGIEVPKDVPVDRREIFDAKSVQRDDSQQEM